MRAIRFPVMRATECGGRPIVSSGASRVTVGRTARPAAGVSVPREARPRSTRATRSLLAVRDGAGGRRAGNKGGSRERRDDVEQVAGDPLRAPRSHDPRRGRFDRICSPPKSRAPVVHAWSLEDAQGTVKIAATSAGTAPAVGWGTTRRRRDDEARAHRFDVVERRARGVGGLEADLLVRLPQRVVSRSRPPRHGGDRGKATCPRWCDRRCDGRQEEVQLAVHGRERNEDGGDVLSAGART